MTSPQPLFERSEFVPVGGQRRTLRPRLAVRDQVLMRCAALDELLSAERCGMVR